MYTVTFYSYKGGVGRTLAVANIADRLSSKGKSVFLLDFDLEAPGLASFFPPEDHNAPGIVEYVSSFAESGSVPPLRSYVTTVRPAGPRTGPINLMGAGRRDSDYQRLLAQLNWKEFYSLHHGYLFVENLKASIEAEYAPDYVLVDSRTGLTDISGICTIQLPNAVVFLFGLNDQNLEGIPSIFHSVTHNKLNKPIETLLVATPIPDLPTRAELREKRVEKAKHLLGRDIDLTLPYSPFVAFSETLVPQGSGTHLGDLYHRLCDKIIYLNKSDVLTLLRDARRLRSDGDPEQTQARYKDIIDTYPKDPEAWTEYGIFLRGTLKLDEALDALKRAVDLGGDSRSQGELSVTYLLMGNDKAADEAFRKFLDLNKNPEQIMLYTDIFGLRRRYDAAMAGYTRILELYSDGSESVPALIGLGNLYMTRREPEKAVLFFEKAASIAPTNMAAAYNFGFSLHLIGRTADALPVLAKAVAIYEQIPKRMSPSRRANVEEAIGNAYLVLGQYERSRAHLVEALEAADAVSSRIYSSIRYEDIPVDDFKKEVTGLLRKADSAIENTGVIAG